MRNDPTQPRASILGPKLAALFWKVVELPGGGAWLEERHHRRQALRL